MAPKLLSFFFSPLCLEGLEKREEFGFHFCLGEERFPVVAVGDAAAAKGADREGEGNKQIGGGGGRTDSVCTARSSMSSN
jgi:hypothetical protein